MSESLDRATAPRRHGAAATAVIATAVALVLLLSLAAVVAASASGYGSLRASTYVGADACKQCHRAAYAAWAGSAHAKATSRLSKRYRDDPRCLQCHATEPTEGLMGVQCEACHGPGRYYRLSYVMKDKELAGELGLQEVSADTCGRCHNERAPNITPFDYERKWDLIRHGSGTAPAPQRTAQ